MAVDTTELSRIELLNSAVADKTGLPVRVVSGGGAGGGDASAANQTTEIVRLTSLLAELQNKADLTETQPVSAASLPLPAGAATHADLVDILNELGTIFTELVGKTEPTDQQHVIVDSSAAVPVTGPLTDVQLRAAAVSGVESRPAAAAVGAVDYATISDTTRNIVLLAANAARKGAHLVNTSDQDVLLREGAAATPVVYTRRLRARSELDLEFPASTAALYGYFSRLPDSPILITERS